MALRKTAPWIFSLESRWTSRLDSQQSVKPLLDALEQTNRVRYIHRGVDTADAFFRLSFDWGQRQYRRYSLGYFAFHGSPGGVYVGRKWIPIEDIAEHVGRRWHGKIVFFASCGVVDISKRDINHFLKTTGARAVGGYVEDVEWYASMAFDLLLFEALSYYRRIDAADRFLRKEYGQLAKKLGYRLYF